MPTSNIDSTFDGVIDKTPPGTPQHEKVLIHGDGTPGNPPTLVHRSSTPLDDDRYGLPGPDPKGFFDDLNRRAGYPPQPHPWVEEYKKAQKAGNDLDWEEFVKRMKEKERKARVERGEPKEVQDKSKQAGVGADSEGLAKRVSELEQCVYETQREIPKHMEKRVKEWLARDRERRNKLRMRYLDEAEEQRDNGNQPERVLFLALAEWVVQGVGSVRQHSQLLNDYNVERDEYNESLDPDSDLDEKTAE